MPSLEHKSSPGSPITMGPSDYPVTPASKSPPQTTSGKKGVKFWLIFASMCTCLFLTALEFTCVSTALPVIAHDLHADSFTWVGSAYALSAAAFLPFSGGLSQAFGRRPTLLLTIAFFALGSGICGGATSMNMLIAGRAIQGLGGGGIQSVTTIVISDLVSLQERGVFTGLFALVWCIAASTGPVVGGALATAGQWRWLFYLNLPISAVASLSVLLFMDLPVPPGTVREKLGRIDWIGTVLVISGAVACMIGLTWGGITAPWKSVEVLVPLVLGFLGLAAFFTYEAKYPKFPLVPFVLMKNRTSLSGYAQTFISQVAFVAAVYFFPVYFQACKGASPIRSGVDCLTSTSVGAMAVVTGLLIRLTLKYRLVLWMGWSITVVGFSLMSTIKATTSIEKVFGLIVLMGVGAGCLQSGPMYPIQAPLPVTQNATALSFMWFLRWFGNVWGVTIGSTVLQNELSKNIPGPFLASVPQGTEIVYALIPSISSFPPALRTGVEVAFANSLQVLWRVLACISAAGLVTSFFMKEIQLTNQVNAEWTLQEGKDLEREAEREAEKV